MENLVITWREILGIAIVVLLVYIAEVLLLMRSSKRGAGARIWQRGALVNSQQQEIDRLSDEVARLRNEVERLQARVEQSEKQSEKMVQAVQSVQAVGNSPYAQAIQLAQQGADAAKVAFQCGISQGEAELIVAMHGPGH